MNSLSIKMNNKIDSFDQLRAFVRVAETQSFVAAADSLDIPKSTLSVLVQRLERQLDTRLFHRTTRSVRLTEAGARFLEKCLTVLDAVEAAESAVLPQMGEVRGHLVVSAPVTLAREFLAPRLPQFLHDYPGIELALRVENHPVDLIAEAVDVALRVGKPPRGELRALQVGGFEGGLTASTAYADRYGLPAMPHELAGHALITGQTSGRMLSWVLQRNDRVVEISQRPRFAVNEIGVAFESIRAGVGIGWLPDVLRAPLVASGELRAVLPAWRLNMTLDLWLVYLERRQRSAPLAAFIEFVQQEFGTTAVNSGQ